MELVVQAMPRFIYATHTTQGSDQFNEVRFAGPMLDQTTAQETAGDAQFQITETIPGSFLVSVSKSKTACAC